MLTGLRIQNFKSWEDTGQIRLAPLTGFFGTNSSGKTALLQMLLLMKQTAESNDRSILLHTGDEKSYVDVGTLYDVAHKKQIPQEISVELDWKPDGLNSYTFEDFEALKKENSIVDAISFDFMRLNFTFNLGEKVTLGYFVYSFSSEDFEPPSHIFKELGLILNQEEKKYKIHSINFNTRFERLMLKLAGDKSLQPVKFYGFSDELSSIRIPFFLFVPALLEKELAKINYLGPLRDYPRRIYQHSGQKPQNVGTRGESSISALLTAKPEVSEKVASWLQKLGLISSFKLQPLAKGRREHETVVQISKNGPEVLLTEVGFGISQVLPVLTLCYYVPENSILILEQPEIHLHPKVQAGLADLFIEVIQERKLQIILESHSEHFLYRLERRIAEKDFSNEQAALYFCRQDDEGVSHLDELQLDKYGNILNWPENFFGDPLGDKLAQNQAQLKEKLKEKEAAKNADNS